MVRQLSAKEPERKLASRFDSYTVLHLLTVDFLSFGGKVVLHEINY